MQFFSRHRNRKSHRIRRLLVETLEDRRLLASVFTNAFNEFDVDDDGFVAPIDALMVINNLNALGPRELAATDLSNQAYLDVSGDGIAAPIDALLVINVLNAGHLPGMLALTEHGSFSEADSIIVTLPLIESGSRSIQFELATRFDQPATGVLSPDQVLVYLFDPSNPGRTILHRGTDGTTVFAVHGASADFTPGAVRFDGKLVQIDASSLAYDGPVGVRVQLLDTDGVQGSRVVARSFAVVTDSQGRTSPSFALDTPIVARGDALDFPSLTPSTGVHLELSNVRFDESTHRYTGELRAVGEGDGLGRVVVATFPNLPTGVMLENASGTENGIPYINLKPCSGASTCRTGQAFAR